MTNSAPHGVQICFRYCQLHAHHPIASRQTVLPACACVVTGLLHTEEIVQLTGVRDLQQIPSFLLRRQSHCHILCCQLDDMPASQAGNSPINTSFAPVYACAESELHPLQLSTAQRNADIFIYRSCMYHLLLIVLRRPRLQFKLGHVQQNL